MWGLGFRVSVSLHQFPGCEGALDSGSGIGVDGSGILDLREKGFRV